MTEWKCETCADQLAVSIPCPGCQDPFPKGHLGDWMMDTQIANKNQRKALKIILDMRNESGLIDAQLIAAMVLNPQDYSLEARQSQGLC